MATLAARITALAGSIRDKLNLMSPKLVPPGGTTGQALVKTSNADHATGWTSLGTVTSVSALTIGTAGNNIGSTVANGSTAPIITLNIPSASASARGALSSADWLTFNGKQAALGFTPENTANRGAANGYAGLDATGKVPAAQLPSYVDDVLEYANYAALPATGEAGKVYILAAPYTSGGITSSQFRWSGSTYAAIIASPGSTDAVTEGATNLYFTQARARAAISVTQNLTYNSGTGLITGPDLSGYVTTTAGNAAYQAKSTELAAFAALGATPGFLRKTGLNTYSVETATYVPTSGAGATGTWGISISGNSANVTGIVAVTNGGTGGATQAAGRTGLGATTVGANLFTMTNPSTVTFLRVNADNTVSPLAAAAFLSAIGGQAALGFTPENTANRGAANGYAGLDAAGKVPAAQLPSYVDDVLEYANYAALPATGEAGKVYILAAPYTSGGITSSQFRWSGSTYAAIIASPGSTDAVTEGATNLYFTQARARAAISVTQNLTYNSGTGLITGPDLSPYLQAATAAATYQPLSTSLTNFLGLGATAGFVRKTGANTYAVDTPAAAKANMGITAAIDGANVNTSESRANATYGDLATVGPVVTMDTGSEVFIDISAMAKRTTTLSGGDAFIAVEVSGATTMPAVEANGVFAAGQHASAATGFAHCLNRRFKLSGLTPGSNTFTLKYKTSSASYNYEFINRSIVVERA